MSLESFSERPDFNKVATAIKDFEDNESLKIVAGAAEVILATRSIVYYGLNLLTGDYASAENAANMSSIVIAAGTGAVTEIARCVNLLAVSNTLEDSEE
jgi:hypothetical protein